MSIGPFQFSKLKLRISWKGSTHPIWGNKDHGRERCGAMMITKQFRGGEERIVGGSSKWPLFLYWKFEWPETGRGDGDGVARVEGEEDRYFDFDFFTEHFQDLFVLFGILIRVLDQ